MLFVRACAPEAAFAAPDEGRAHYPSLYLAGGYKHAKREAGGECVPITALVNLPHPFGLSFRIDGEPAWFTLDGVEVLHYRHRLAVWLRGGRLALHLRDRSLQVSLDGAAPAALALRFRGERLLLGPGGSLCLPCR